MKKGELDNAKRRALNKFDEWNAVTDVPPKHSGYYYELQAVIEDAVECGAQAAIGIEEPLSSEKDDEPNDQAQAQPPERDVER